MSPALLSRFRRDPIAVETFAEASRITCSDRDAHGVGSSEWSGTSRARGPGRITVGGKLVAYVSYNGRVWMPGASPTEVADYNARIAP